MAITVEEINEEISKIQNMVSSHQTKILEADLSLHLPEGVSWSELPTKEECIKVLEAYKITLQIYKHRSN